MTMTNPITQQIREIRHRLAAKFDNDLDRIVDDLQRQERESRHRLVDRSKQATNHAMHRSGGGDVLDNGGSIPATR
jgi:hypothetical protein